MRPRIKKPAEIDGIREACRIAATVLDRMIEFSEVGMTTWDLDQEGRRLIESMGATSGCYGYRNGKWVYPGYTCISVNEEIIHGIGTMNRVLQGGDVLSLDVCVSWKGFIGDNARTIILDEASAGDQHLVNATRDSLYVGISKALAGKRTGDVSVAVQKFIEERDLSIVREFCGHGVGLKLHEPPEIPNYGRKGQGQKLVPGMTIAIEPMVNAGGPSIRMMEDGWTACTKDGSRAAHFEHTVLITSDGPEILTIPDGKTLEDLAGNVPLPAILAR